MIELRGVSKQYLYGARLLGSVDLKIDDGEIAAVFGGEGSGKTTCLKVIAGVTDCEGEVIINGVQVSEKSSKQLGDDVLMLFDDLALFKNKTCRFNIGYPLIIRGYSKEETEKIVDAAAEKAGIVSCLNMKVKKMSALDTKRIGIARLFIREFKTLLIDDITGGLERKDAEQLWAELAPLIVRFKREGKSVVVATENFGEAASAADRIAIIHAGEIKQIGRLNELWDSPKNIWAAEAADKYYHFERARICGLDGGLKLVLGIETPVSKAEEYSVDISAMREKIPEEYIGKTVFAGWHSDCFAESGERKESVEYALYENGNYILHTAGGIRIRSEKKTDAACTLPRAEGVRIYDFASENCVHLK